MIAVKRLVLDILKPLEPNALEFCKRVAGSGDDYRVILSVVEIDKITESLQLTVEGHAINIEAVTEVIEDMGGSLHSIDEVEAKNEPNVH